MNFSLHDSEFRCKVFGSVVSLAFLLKVRVLKVQIPVCWFGFLGSCDYLFQGSSWHVQGFRIRAERTAQKL